MADAPKKVFIPIDKVARNMAEGVNEGIGRHIARGAPESEAISTAERRLQEFAAFPVGPDFNLTLIPKPSESRSQREALLSEIRAQSGGFIRSKWPNSPMDYHISEKYVGEEVALDISGLIGAIHRSHHSNDEHIPRPRGRYGYYETVQPAFKKLENFSVFIFETAAYHSDGARCTDTHGRPYPFTVTIFMPHETAEKFFNFVLREDPNMIVEVYKTLFPRNYENNTIRLSSEMTVVKDGQEFPVPPFTPVQ